MPDLNDYLSELADPYSDLLSKSDQSIINGKNLISFEIDSIINSIGKTECKYNIDAYLKKLLQDMNDEDVTGFLQMLIPKINEVYNVTTFEMISGNETNNIVNKKQMVRGILDFFEKEGWVHIFSKCFIVDNAKVFMTPQLKEFLISSYEHFINNIGLFKDQINSELLKFFLFAPKDEVIECLFRIISRNKIAIVSDFLITQLEEQKNVNN